LAIFAALNDLSHDSDFINALLTSTMLALEAVFFTFVISLTISYATVIPFFRPLGQVVSKMRFLSLVGLSFVFMLMASSGHTLKVSLLVFSMVVFFVTSMLEEIGGVTKNEFNHARTLGMTEWHIVWEVIIRGRLDKAFEIMRQNFAIAWMMLTMVEGISRTEGGIGTMLLNQNKHFRLDSVFAIQIVIFILGMSMDYFFGLVKDFLFPYSSLTVESK